MRKEIVKKRLKCYRSARALKSEASREAIAEWYIVSWKDSAVIIRSCFAFSSVKPPAKRGLRRFESIASGTASSLAGCVLDALLLDSM